MKTRAIAVLVALGLAASACGSGATEPAAPAASGESGGGTFPAVEVISLNSGATVDFSEQLADGEQAILLWFWAPH